MRRPASGSGNWESSRRRHRQRHGNGLIGLAGVHEVVRPAVTEGVAHRPHPRTSSRDTAHSGRCCHWSLTSQETTTTSGSGASSSNPRVAGSTPARRTTTDSDFAARVTPPACSRRIRDTLSGVGSFLSVTASPGRESHRVRSTVCISARISQRASVQDADERRNEDA
jgi:hypothetical protein